MQIYKIYKHTKLPKCFLKNEKFLEWKGLVHQSLEMLDPILVSHSPHN